MPAKINGASPCIAQTGRQRKEHSGAALSSWPVELQGLHKQNETWASLEIFRLIELDGGSLRVSVSQNLRADQHMLRVSKLFGHNDTPQQHTTTTTLFCLHALVATCAIAVNNTARVLSCRLVPHKRWIDCARRSGPGSISKRESVLRWMWRFQHGRVYS